MVNNSNKKKRAQAARAEAKAKKARRDMLIVIGGVAVIALGILGAAFVFGGNDTGVTTATAWDLPALQGDLDGDGVDDRFKLGREWRSGPESLTDGSSRTSTGRTATGSTAALAGGAACQSLLFMTPRERCYGSFKASCPAKRWSHG